MACNVEKINVNNLRQYAANVLKIWDALLNIDESVAPKLTDFPLVSAIFDIEAGVLKEKSLRKFTTPVTGYVQVIGVSFTSLTHALDLQNIKHLLLVYKKPDLDFNVVMEKAQKEFLNNTAVEIIYFESELELLLFFAGVLVPNIDLLEGYNSDQFDMPFIMARINLLVDGDSIVFNPKKNFFLFGYKEDINFSLQTRHFYYFLTTCKKCNQTIMLEKCYNQKESFCESGGGSLTCVMCFEVCFLVLFFSFVF